MSGTTVSSSLEEQIFAAKRRAEEFTRSLREAREREAKALEALEGERLKWGNSISIRDSYKSIINDDLHDIGNGINSIESKEEEKVIESSSNVISVIDSNNDININENILLDSIKNEENRDIAINESIDGSIGSFSLVSHNRSFDSTTDHHKDKEKSLQLQVIALEKQVKALRKELIIANTELRVAKAHTTTLEQRLSEHITNNDNDNEKINLFAKLTTTEAYAKGLENRLEDVDKTYKLQLSSEEELRAVLKNRVAELERGYIEQKLRADKIESEANHSIRDGKSLHVEIEKLAATNGYLQGQVDRSKAEIKRLKMQVNGNNDDKIATLIPTIANIQDSGESQQSLKRWIEEFKSSERYNIDNDAVNIEDGLDNFATSSVLNPDRAFQTLVERKPILPKESNRNVESTSPQFKKVKEKKQDSVAVTSPQLTKLQQPKPNNSKITSPYNLSSLAAKSPINSIFRNINAKVNESLENKNKKSIKVTLPTQSVVSRNVKSSGYGEKKPASNPVKQQQAATSRLSKGTASKQTTRSSHDSSINKGINISMASSLSLGEGPSNDSMFIDVKKAVQKSSNSQSVTRTSLTKSSSIQKTSRTSTPTVKRSSSVDARISKTKR
jgi:hypothetical protein